MSRAGVPLQPDVSVERVFAPDPPVRREEPAAPRIRKSVFGELLPLRLVADDRGPLGGRELTIAEELARALRRTLLSYAGTPSPAVLSGHAPDGRPLARPHTAFLALPDVTAGAVVGAMAIAVPRGADPPEMHAILLAAHAWERSGMRLLLGRCGVLGFTRADERGPYSDEWVGPARRWASVTPVALDRNPGKLFGPDRTATARAVLCAEETIAAACTHVGLPRPEAVRIARSSLVRGIPPAAAFMPFPRRPGALQRVCVHVEVRFEEPVLGPVLLGVGRYYGMGLCAALR